MTVSNVADVRKPWGSNERLIWAISSELLKIIFKLLQYFFSCEISELFWCEVIKIKMWGGVFHTWKNKSNEHIDFISLLFKNRTEQNRTSLSCFIKPTCSTGNSSGRKCFSQMMFLSSWFGSCSVSRRSAAAAVSQTSWILLEKHVWLKSLVLLRTPETVLTTQRGVGAPPPRQPCSL